MIGDLLEQHSTSPEPPDTARYALAVAVVVREAWPTAAPAWEKELAAEVARLGFVQDGWTRITPLVAATLAANRPELRGNRTRRRLAGRYQVRIAELTTRWWAAVEAVALFAQLAAAERASAQLAKRADAVLPALRAAEATDAIENGRDRPDARCLTESQRNSHSRVEELRQAAAGVNARQAAVYDATAAAEAALAARFADLLAPLMGPRAEALERRVRALELGVSGEPG